MRDSRRSPSAIHQYKWRWAASDLNAMSFDLKAPALTTITYHTAAMVQYVPPFSAMEVTKPSDTTDAFSSPSTLT